MIPSAAWRMSLKHGVVGALVLVPATGRVLSSLLPGHSRSATTASTESSESMSTRTNSAAGAPFVSVSGSGGLDRATITALQQRATTLELNSTVLHQATIDLTTISRSGVVIRAVPTGAGIPMSFLAVDPGSTALNGE